MQWMWGVKTNSIDPPGDTHKLTAVKNACDEAKRRLQHNSNGLKEHQEKVGHEMKKYKELLRQLETEYSNTMEDIKTHKEQQVSESFLCYIFYSPICMRASGKLTIVCT